MLYKFLQTILLAACGYVLMLAIQNNLLLYIHPRYVLFTVVMVAICLVLSVLAFSSTKTKVSFKSLAGYTPIIILLLVGLGLPATSLTSFSVAQRSSSSGNIGDNTVTRGSSTIDLYGDSSKNLKLADWARLITRNTDPNFYANRPIEVSGFVYDTGNSESFQVARFVVTCCAVDAQPTGITVYSTDWRSNYKEDQWVQVNGKIIEKNINGQKLLVIEPENINEIEEPDNPYAN